MPSGVSVETNEKSHSDAPPMTDSGAVATTKVVDRDAVGSAAKASPADAAAEPKQSEATSSSVARPVPPPVVGEGSTEVQGAYKSTSSSVEPNAASALPQAPVPISFVPPVNTTIIRVSGLPFAMTPEQLRRFFGSFEVAEEEDAALVFTCGEHRGEGFVRLKRSDDVMKAVEKLHRNRIGERYLELSVSSEADRARAVAEREEYSKATDTFVLRLRGLPFDSTEDEVREFVKTVDGILRLDMCKDLDGRNTGDAFIEVKTSENVEQARLLHEKTLGPRYIEVLQSTVFDRNSIMTAAARRSRSRGNGTALGLGPRQQGYMYGGYSQPYARPRYMRGGRGMGYHSPGVAAGMYMPYDAMQPYSTYMMGDCEGDMGPGPSYMPNGMLGEYPHGGGAGFYAPPAPAYNYDGMYPNYRHSSTYVVRIRGLPFTATEDLIAGFFEGVAILPQGVHMVYNAENNLTGEAFVELETVEDMEKALAKSGGAMGHRYIEVFSSTLAELQRLGTTMPASADAVATAPMRFGYGMDQNSIGRYSHYQ